MPDDIGGQQANPAAEPVAAPAGIPEGAGQTQGQAAVTATGGSPDGSHEQHWMGEDLKGQFNERDAGVLKRFGSVGDLAKGYINAFDLVGRNKIPMPQNEDEWGEVYNRLGRPADPKEYQLVMHGDYPEDFKQEMEGHGEWFKNVAHELGLNDKQAANMYNKYMQRTFETRQNIAAQTNAQVKSEMNSAVRKLKTEYGQAFDSKLVLANRAVSHVGGEDLIKVLTDSGLGRHPAVVKAFIKIGEGMAEEVGLDKGGQNIHSNDDLDSQIAEIQADPAYSDRKSPQQKVLVKKMQKLMQLRHPEPKVQPGTIRLF